MTEKRCTIHNGQIILDGFPLSNEKAAALINELLEEIRIFKIKDVRKLFSRRKLESFHDNIFEVIDKKIAEYEEKNHDANCGDCICVKYYNQIECLKELKKDLDNEMDYVSDEDKMRLAFAELLNQQGVDTGVDVDKLLGEKIKEARMNFQNRGDFK